MDALRPKPSPFGINRGFWSKWGFGGHSTECLLFARIFFICHFQGLWPCSTLSAQLPFARMDMVFGRMAFVSPLCGLLQLLQAFKLCRDCGIDLIRHVKAPR